MMGVAVLFLVPAYYLAKSKGYNVVAVLVASAVFSMGIPLLINIIEYPNGVAFGADITFPFLALAVVWLLPKRKGAPGKAYLKITFDCPECKAEVTFPRGREGRAELCPKCGEIITVPLDRFSPKSAPVRREKPDVDDWDKAVAAEKKGLPTVPLSQAGTDEG